MMRYGQKAIDKKYGHGFTVKKHTFCAITGKQRLCIYGLRVCWWSSIVTKLLARCFYQNRSYGVAVSMHHRMQKPNMYLWLWLLREWISRTGMPAALHSSAYIWVSLAVVKKTRTCKALLLSQMVDILAMMMCELSLHGAADIF